MILTFGQRQRRRGHARLCSLTGGGGWVPAIFIILQAWAIDPATAQSAAPSSYRIAAGDKIGVTVFGQPELSGESAVDQSGNIRLPMVGDIYAVNLTPSELERSIAHSLEQGYVRRPVVSAKITEFRPIYVLGLVRTPGLCPYREGLSVLGAIAHAGGIGASESRQGGVLGDLLLADERVRVLEASRVALLTKRARLIAQQNADEHIEFPDMSGGVVDPARIAQIRDSEQRAFTAERQAAQQEIEALQKQGPRLGAEIASIQQQIELELQQRTLNHELVADYEQLMKTGLARKSNYIEVRREEARIEGNIARLKTDLLKAELSIGDIQFRITELRNDRLRRVIPELGETERSLLELAVTLPAAQLVRTARAQQIGLLTAEQAQQPAITVIRAKGTTNVKLDGAVDLLLQPGDVVQVGSLFPPGPVLPSDPLSLSREKAAQSEAPSRTGEMAAAQGAPLAGR
jgi:polysaccharide export outer membrane protein